MIKYLLYSFENKRYTIFIGVVKYMKPKKTYDKIMSGDSDNNINFADLQHLLDHMGFQHKKTNGDHFLYFYKNCPEIINIQPIGSKAKGYQIKQIRNFINKNKLTV